jgi:hypothetical protein
VASVKTALGWTSDPPPSEIETRVEESLAVQPELAEKLLDVLKGNENPAVSGLVGSIVSHGQVLDRRSHTLEADSGII